MVDIQTYPLMFLFFQKIYLYIIVVLGAHCDIFKSAYYIT
jgi:hypothetical protein